MDNAMLLTEIGELIAIEIHDVKDVFYERNNSDSFAIKLQNGEKYILTIKKELP